MDATPTWRSRIEDGLGRWAGLVVHGRFALILGFTLATVGLATFIPSMEVKLASEDFLFEDDPVRERYDAFKADFGQDQVAILAITPPEIFDLAFLEKLAAFHRDLEDEVPFLEDLTSLVDVRSTYGRGDELVVEDLLEDMPETEAELAALEARVRSTPFYTKTGILSSDGRSTGVRVEVAVYGEAGAPEAGVGDADGLDLGGFDDDFGEEGFGEAGEGGDPASGGKRAFLSGAENARVIHALRRVIARYEGPDFQVESAGGTMLTYALTEQLGIDVPRFFGGGLVVIAVLLGLLFRRVMPIFLGLAVVVPATLATFGLASVLGLAFSAPAQIIPSFLLAIGVSYSVHLITIFMRALSHGDSREAALEYALRHSGLPILMTGLTTSAGLLSFLAAAMKPIQELGMISSVGVAVTLCYAMGLLPALLVTLPVSARPPRASSAADRFLATLASISARRPWPIVAVAVFLAIVALASMTRLHPSSDPTSWFPRDHDYAVGSAVLNARFGGTGAFEVVVDTGRDDGLKDPALMRRLDAIEELVEGLKAEGARFTHTNSIVDIVKETHQALNANDPAYFAIPDDPRLLAQELLLFENSGSDDLEKVVDTRFSRARYTIRNTWTDGVYIAPVLERFGPAVRETIGDLAEVEVTGMSIVIARTVDAVMESMLRSYGLALALITPLMIFLIGSLRSGLVSMVPNLLPILLTLGLMGVVGIPIDMFTLLAGCIAIGLAVDDSIHFIAGFRRALARGLDPVRAVEETMQSTGRALLFTSIVLTSGFAVLLMSDMLNLRNVGTLTSFAIATAFLLDVTVTPALLVLTHGREARAARAAAEGAVDDEGGLAA